jgi:hypothetical protein
MAKFKPIRPKREKAAVPARGAPCIILIVGLFILAMLFLYFVMKNANG